MLLKRVEAYLRYVCVRVCVCECIPEVREVAAPLPDAVANEHQRIYWLHIYLVYQ